MEDLFAELTPPRLAAWPRDSSLLVRIGGFVEALAQFIWLDLSRISGFRQLHTVVARTGTSPRAVDYDALALVRAAVRDACVFYPKRVLCLQRSAAVTCMLRRRGLPAS